MLAFLSLMRLSNPKPCGVKLSQPGMNIDGFHQQQFDQKAIYPQSDCQAFVARRGDHLPW